MLLKEHHLRARGVERLPLLKAALEGVFAAVPLLPGKLRSTFSGSLWSSIFSAFSGKDTKTLSQTSASGSARVRQ